MLLAVMQRGGHTLVAVEEPEATVHPAAMDIVVETLLDASNDKQILLTTHSPDLLDSKAIADDQIRIVVLEEGRTIIGPLARGNRDVVRDGLYTLGELLRIDELMYEEGPDEGMGDSEDPDQMGFPGVGNEEDNPTDR